MYNWYVFQPRDFSDLPYKAGFVHVMYLVPHTANMFHALFLAILTLFLVYSTQLVY